jgi:hypothetical protein
VIDLDPLGGKQALRLPAIASGLDYCREAALDDRLRVFVDRACHLRPR